MQPRSVPEFMRYLVCRSLFECCGAASPLVVKLSKAFCAKALNPCISFKNRCKDN